LLRPEGALVKTRLRLRCRQDREVAAKKKDLIIILKKSSCISGDYIEKGNDVHHARWRCRTVGMKGSFNEYDPRPLGRDELFS
jgi:hypothetical protein